MRVKYSLLKVLATEISIAPWYQQLASPGNQVIRSMGLPIITAICSACDSNKIHKKPFNHHFEHASKPFDCVHIDIVAPISPLSVPGNHYSLTIIDQ
ncbi:hypothetical protein O181_019886 [Austropuccinia psidii MF-1]|uniref:Uncharacterized protein n=1 Tax=Austropuccinia psidii MF-1 TaxID=1389203 RepID=A0A9Q3CCG5_9BASI|nr:hypothetical protein [Austropuccinia psidii MF-1]